MPSYSSKISEATLINKIAKDFFAAFDTSDDLNSNVDLIVASKGDPLFRDYYCFIEAKKGHADNTLSLIQLILTVGKAKKLPSPKFLAALNCEEIVFIPFPKIRFIFTQSDFNWNVRASNHYSREFAQMQGLINEILNQERLNYSFSKDEKELKHFIASNFQGSGGRLEITEDNLVEVYEKWLANVRNSIAVRDWDALKAYRIVDADFFLADLLSEKNQTLAKKLFVLLQSDHYKYDIKKTLLGEEAKTLRFTDKQAAHKAFWRRYKRPPDEKIWDTLIKRRDLLLPKDLRERKGAFFTPPQWVVKAHQYIAQALGEDWWEHYDLWDPAAGTGNLLSGLKNKNIFASTCDEGDVGAMQTRRKLAGDGANLKENHIFKFDFLNDPLPCSLHSDPKKHANQCFNCKNFKPESTTLPRPLIDILRDEQRRKKLIILINPPYAEAGNKNKTQGAKHKGGVSTQNPTYERYKTQMGKASNELFAQFFMRIHKEISGCILAQFSTLKIVQGANFAKFRAHFRAQFLRGFLVPADTFDNVRGAFPIGFMVWDLGANEAMQECIRLDVFSRANQALGVKNCYVDTKFLSSFGKIALEKDEKILGYFAAKGNDFQHQNSTFIENAEKPRPPSGGVNIYFSARNLLQICISFAIRHAIPASWINDREQFLWPNDAWVKDKEFQHDCLAFALFHKQNRIVSAADGTNHLIPFSSDGVGAKESFKSEFMREFLAGKIKLQKPPPKPKEKKLLLDEEPGAQFPQWQFEPKGPLEFSPEAGAVFEAGRALFAYYHGLEKERFFHAPYNANASLYEIKEFFQGRGKTGKMNPPAKCQDERYKELLSELNNCLLDLAKKIKPKIYDYGFLRE